MNQYPERLPAKNMYEIAFKLYFWHFVNLSSKSGQPVNDRFKDQFCSEYCKPI